MERITVTLPEDVVLQIDQHDRNRSRFVLGAVRAELERRRHEELLRSLAEPHGEAEELAEAGFDDWAARFPDEDTNGLLEQSKGRSIRWSPNEGWKEADD